MLCRHCTWREDVQLAIFRMLTKAVLDPAVSEELVYLISITGRCDLWSNLSKDLAGTNCILYLHGVM